MVELERRRRLPRGGRVAPPLPLPLLLLLSIVASAARAASAAEATAASARSASVAFVAGTAPPFRRRALTTTAAEAVAGSWRLGRLRVAPPSAGRFDDPGDGGDEDVPLWKTEATDMIRSAAIDAGADPSRLAVEWKPGKVVVTVGGEIGLGSAHDDEEAAEVLYDDDDLGIYDDEDFEKVFGDDDDEEDGPSITSIARAINDALYNDTIEHGELSVGKHVATTHEIEVTTPGASDVLEGDVMFDAYRGFDVIVETSEIRKGKKRIVEGKLIERDEEYTRVNVKGRVTKVKNEKVECVRLPKAKREKGVK